MALHEARPREGARSLSLPPQFARPGETREVPRDRIPESGLPPDTAYQIVNDELLLDGNARLNLASFVTTWMEPQARRLMDECVNKNFIDRDEYPRTTELERRCVRMLADLWSAPPDGPATGCSTTGSSEACMLGGLALLRRWSERRRGARGAHGRPNLVMGANVQVCWDKFCRYWDVEPRQVPLGPGRTHLTADGAAAHCDENTIGVVAIMGSTFDGSYEPVAEIAGALDRLQDERGLDVPIHVDAASGGFIAPFLDPDIAWDFRVPRVQSINASGHKYGLVYPGIGWIVWRDRRALPDGLVFGVDYLGGEMPTFALTFSRPGAQVAAQYYNLLRLGRDGYRRVQQSCSGHGDVAGLEDRRAGPVRAALGRQRRSRIRVPPTGRCAQLHGIRCLRRAPPLRLDRASVPHAAAARGCRGAAHRGAQRVQPRSGGAAARAPRARRRRAGTYGWPSRRTTRHRLPPLGGTVCRLFGMASGPEHIRATFWLLDAHDSLARQGRREPDGTGLGWYEAGTYPERLRDPEP